MDERGNAWGNTPILLSVSGVFIRRSRSVFEQLSEATRGDRCPSLPTARGLAGAGVP